MNMTPFCLRPLLTAEKLRIREFAAFLSVTSAQNVVLFSWSMKTHLAKNLRAEALVPEVPAEFDVAEEPAYDLVRTKRFTVKPMSTEEAILQMNLLDHSFYVFRDVETETVSVVYRRNNGGYGLIETN